MSFFRLLLAKEVRQMHQIEQQMVDESYTDTLVWIKMLLIFITHQHSLTAINQFPKETHNVESTLPIKPRSWLIQKQ